MNSPPMALAGFFEHLPPIAYLPTLPPAETLPPPPVRKKVPRGSPIVFGEKIGPFEVIEVGAMDELGQRCARIQCIHCRAKDLTPSRHARRRVQCRECGSKTRSEMSKND